ncbi:MAG: hypothetical protein RIT35_1039 [Pseudomonadota bacterium]|jgi:DNA-binding protein HU-beta
MNKNDLVTKISEKSSTTKVDSTKILNAFIEAVTEALASGDEIRLIGFGTFSVYQSKATEAKNPRTGAKIMIPASKRPKFKAGKLLKDAVNK